MCRTDQMCDAFLTIFTLVLLASSAMLSFCLSLYMKPRDACLSQEMKERYPFVRHCSYPVIVSINLDDNSTWPAISSNSFHPWKHAIAQSDDIEHVIDTTDNFLVSLSILVYIDDPENKIFVCAGVVVSSKEVLFASTCLRDTNVDYLTVRGGSRFWSTFGWQFKVEKGFKLPQMPVVLLNVVPEIEFSNALNKISIAQKLELKYRSVGWQKSRHQRYLNKYQMYTQHIWSAKECENKCRQIILSPNPNVSQEFDCKSSEPSGNPLITNSGYLIGLQMGDDCNQYFGVFFSVLNMKINLNKTESNNFPLLKEPIVLYETYIY